MDDRRGATAMYVWLVVLSLASGCTFVSRQGGTEVVYAPSVDEIVVAANGTCTLVTYSTYEVRTTKTLEVQSLGRGYYQTMSDLADTRILAPFALVGLAFGSAAGVVTFPIAATDVLISNQWPTRERGRRVIEKTPISCLAPIGHDTQVAYSRRFDAVHGRPSPGSRSK